MLDFGIEEIDITQIDPGIDKAETSRRILAGEIVGGKRDAALANAALLFYLANATPLQKGTALAREILESGIPYQILIQYAIDTTNDRTKKIN